MKSARAPRAASSPAPSAVLRAALSAALSAAKGATIGAPIRAVFRAGLCAALAVLPLAGCAVVKPYEREKLADPIMDPDSPVGKQTLERKFQSTREGGSGGGTGSGGGCGCAK